MSARSGLSQRLDMLTRESVRDPDGGPMAPGGSETEHAGVEHTVRGIVKGSPMPAVSLEWVEAGDA